MARGKVYSPEFVQAALEALKLNGGNIPQTARQLDIPPRTLRHWQGGSIPANTAGAIEVKKDRAAYLQETGDLFVAAARETIAPGSRSKRNPQQLMTAAGIAYDKAEIIRKTSPSARGDSTENDLAWLGVDLTSLSSPERLELREFVELQAKRKAEDLIRARPVICDHPVV